MNSNADKKSVARHKVLMHHFSDFSGHFSMMEFKGMEPELLMRSLIFLDKWGAENNDGASYDVARHSILFHLVRINPVISVLHENDKGGDHKRRRVL
jgi:hypothetical protein